MLDLQSYLRGKGRNVPLKKGRLDLTSYMLGKSASGGIQKITGALPLTVRSRASQVLKNYIIYGTVSGVGVRTENLFDYAVQDTENGYVANKALRYDNTLSANDYDYLFVSEYIEIEQNTDYITNTLYRFESATLGLCLYDENHNYIIGYSYSSIYEAGDTQCLFNSGDAVYVRMTIYKDYASSIMLVEGSTAPSTYIPYGYKLSLKVTADGTTTDYPIYIGDSKLSEEEYVDYESGKVYKLKANLVNFPDTQQTLRNQWYINTKINAALTDGNYTISYTIEGDILNFSLIILYGDSSRPLGELARYDNQAPYTIIEKEFSWDSTVGDTLWVRFVRYSSRQNYTYTVRNVMLVAGSGTFQPTDPPVPLPDITLPQGEVTIDTEEEVKPQTTIKGKIEQI